MSEIGDENDELAGFMFSFRRNLMGDHERTDKKSRSLNEHEILCIETLTSIRTYNNKILDQVQKVQRN